VEIDLKAPAAGDGQVDVRTRLGSVMGTLGYMSPEQARGEPATTASDMYSCGLLLQEIFTGRPPYDPGIDRATLLARAAKGETVPVTGIDPGLAALIGRLKSLAPAERPSARDTAERLDWIRAKPARRRKRALVAAVMAGLALLSAFSTVQTIRARREARRANQEAEAARQVSDFLVGLFRVSDPGQARGNTVTAREILDRGATKIDQDLRAQPLVQARLISAMGRVYDSLGSTARPPTPARSQPGKAAGDEHLDVTRLVALRNVRWHRASTTAAPPLRAGPCDSRASSGPRPTVADSLHLNNLLWAGAVRQGPGPLTSPSGRTHPTADVAALNCSARSPARGGSPRRAGCGSARWPSAKALGPDTPSSPRVSTT
jgi:hypothetical protein